VFFASRKMLALRFTLEKYALKLSAVVLAVLRFAAWKIPLGLVVPIPTFPLSNIDPVATVEADENLTT
jgi:hypothetical protein